MKKEAAGLLFLLGDDSGFRILKVNFLGRNGPLNLSLGLFSYRGLTHELDQNLDFLRL